MEKQNWKYRIRSGKTPVILTFTMFALFGGLTIWLHSTQNGAFIFTGLLAAIMLLVLLLTIHRLMFYKVLIGDDGFYYQTSIGNGKYYAYTDIEKAWISSGTAQNGGQEQYCNIAAYGETVIRFQFFYNDKKGVEYLVKRVTTVGQRNTATTVADKDEYLIDGKVFGKIKIGIGLVLLAIIVFIDVLIIKEIGFNAMLIPGIAMELALCWMLFIDYVFFQVKIGKDSFYCRTNPFNGQWYKYGEITSCREIKKVVRHRQHHWNAAQRRYYFFFEFTDVKGKTRKFQFSKEIFEHEVNVLKERIEQAQG